MNETSKILIEQPNQQSDSNENDPQIESEKVFQIRINDQTPLYPPTNRERPLSIEPEQSFDNEKSHQQPPSQVLTRPGTPKAERPSFGNIVCEADQKQNGELSHIRKAMNAGKSTANNGLAFLKGLVSYWRKDLHELSHEELLEIATFILRKPLEKRTVKDMNLLLRGSVAIEFFQQYDQKTIENCFKCMFYVFMHKGQTVFEIGSMGTTHWVILKGSVGVWASDRDQLEDEQEEIVQNKGGKVSEIKVLTAGSSFGERALQDNQPRKITVRCKEDCHFAVLDKKDYSYILMEKEARRIAEEIDFFASLPMLKDWSQKAVRNMLYFSKITKFHRGQKLYKEGDDPEKFYIVRKGEFKILKHVEIKGDVDPVWQTPIDNIKKQSVTKKSLELAILCEKEIFGEEELLHDKRRQYTIVCHSIEGEVYEVDKKVFFEKILKSSIASKWITGYSEGRLEYYKNKVFELCDSKLKNKGLLMFERKDFKYDRLSLHIVARDYAPKEAMSKLRENKSLPSKCVLGTSESNKKLAETRRPQNDEATQIIERINTADASKGRLSSATRSQGTSTPSRFPGTPGPSGYFQRNPNTLYQMSSKLWRDEVSSKIDARRSASLLKQAKLDSREESPSLEEKRSASRTTSKKFSHFREESGKLSAYRIPELLLPPQGPEAFELLSTSKGRSPQQSPNKYSLNINIPTLSDRTVAEIKLTSPNYHPQPPMETIDQAPPPESRNMLLLGVKPPTFSESPFGTRRLPQKIRTSVRKVSSHVNLRSPSNEVLLAQQDKYDAKSKNIVLFNNAISNHELQFLSTLNSQDRGVSQMFKNIHMVERKRKDMYGTQNGFERASLKLQNDKLEDILRLNTQESTQNNQENPDIFKPMGSTSKFQWLQSRDLPSRGSQSSRTSRSRPKTNHSAATFRARNPERVQTAMTDFHSLVTGISWRKRVI